MYELHIANKNYSSWSLRPWLLLTELGIPFREHLHVFDGIDNWSAFREFSPNGKVPCLVASSPTDGNDRLVIWDSLAIVEFVAERHPGVWPADPEARAWARCAAAEMHAGFPALRSYCGMNCGLRARLQETPPALERELARLDELWCEGLERFGGDFLAGAAFGAVDAFYAPVAFRVQTYDLTLSSSAASYVQRLLALDGMRSWYEAGLLEPWRDSSHEEEWQAVAERVDDLRRA